MHIDLSNQLADDRRRDLAAGFERSRLRRESPRLPWWRRLRPTPRPSFTR